MLSKLLIILIPPQYVRVSHPIQEFARKKDKKTEKCNSIVNVAGYITGGGGYGRAEKKQMDLHIFNR